MAHYTTRSGYESLVERLNRFPQGAPPSDALYGILKLQEKIKREHPLLGPEWVKEQALIAKAQGVK